MLRKILAVDDSALIHQMYVSSRYKNCRPVSAMNGLEALDKPPRRRDRPHPPDINMPVMNGLSLRARKKPRKDIPVIIISTEGKERHHPRPQDGRPWIREEALPGIGAPQPDREDHGAVSLFVPPGSR
jgi:CheY-like chemotaxis protein